MPKTYVCIDECTFSPSGKAKPRHYVPGDKMVSGLKDVPGHVFELVEQPKKKATANKAPEDKGAANIG